ncbi:unnamed protein product [Rotaria magnacalcarata]|uniref:Uncharacterized protein n=1 Tax=Rotaria magnacalcarata TaxID=392030 RepID=A0A816RLT3_9BILA|nr:unnamed protein product [Rotaria magnacalcarata]
MDNQNLALPDLIRIDHIISQNIQLQERVCQLQERVRQLEIREVANNLVRTADRIQLERENMELRAELRERKMVPNLVVVSCVIILLGILNKIEKSADHPVVHVEYLFLQAFVHVAEAHVDTDIVPQPANVQHEQSQPYILTFC